MQRKTITFIFSLFISVLIVLLASAQSIDVDDLPDTGNIVLPQSIYVRRGPSREAQPIGEYTSGKFVYPIGIHTDGDWVVVAFNELFGWVGRDVIRWSDDIDNLPVYTEFDPLPTVDPAILSATPFIPTATLPSSFVLIDADNAFIRSGPGRNYDIVRQVAVGDLIENPVGRNADVSWILFQYMDGSQKRFGWIFAPLVQWYVDLIALPILSENNLTPSATFTPSYTPTATYTATSTYTPSATATQTDTPTPTVTPSNTATVTPTSTATITPSFTATATSTATLTPTSTATFTLTPQPTATLTSTMTFTFTPVLTATATNEPTATMTAMPTDEPTLTHTATSTATGTPTPTATNTNTATIEPTLTDEPTSTAIDTPTFVPTATHTHTSTMTPEPTLTATLVPTATSTATPTDEPTLTHTSTATGTPTPTATNTNTATIEPTLTDEPTVTSTFTPTTAPTATNTHTATIAPSPTSTATNTAIPTIESTVTHTDIPTNEPTAEVTDEVTAIAEVIDVGDATPTQLTEIEITEIPPTGDDATGGSGRFPIEAVVGIIIFLLILLYVALYWNGLSSADRYADGFVVEDCPVCNNGKLHVESRQDRLFGIPLTRHTVRCDNCRSVLRETGNRRWRYAVDRVENPELFDRYNGKQIMTGELATLLVRRQSTLGTKTMPEFIDEDAENEE